MIVLLLLATAECRKRSLGANAFDVGIIKYSLIILRYGDIVLPSFGFPYLKWYQEHDSFQHYGYYGLA